MKIIYGYDLDYEALVANNDLETLESRRCNALLKFALKAEASDRFGPSWFNLSHSDRNFRPSTMNKYVEKRFRTERGKNGPIAVMTRLLNEHYK